MKMMRKYNLRKAIREAVFPEEAGRMTISINGKSYLIIPKPDGGVIVLADDRDEEFKSLLAAFAEKKCFI